MDYRKEACLLIFCILCSNTGFAKEEIPSPNWNEDIPNRVRPKGTLCGINSTYIALKVFHINANYDEILFEMPPGIYGNTMDQIVCYINKKTELNVSPIKCDSSILYKNLKRQGAIAIINIADHWCVILNITDNCFEIYDYPKKYLMPVEEIDKYWEGYAILIKRKGISVWIKGAGIGLLITGISILGQYLTKKGSSLYA